MLLTVVFNVVGKEVQYPQDLELHRIGGHFLF